MPDDREFISDPKRLRALAHPLRWRLITLVGAEGTATATRCAEALNESVASCSYHLNMLAKYDFVEEVPTEGRERPWRLTQLTQSFDDEGLPLEGQLALEAAGEAFIESEFAGLRERLRARSRDTEEWRRASRLMATVAYLTPTELTEINDQLSEILDRYLDRLDKPELRPDGARAVRLFTSAFPMSERRP